MNDPLVTLYQDCSNRHDSSKTMAAKDLHCENVEKSSYREPLGFQIWYVALSRGWGQKWPYPGCQ